MDTEIQSSAEGIPEEDVLLIKMGLRSIHRYWSNQKPYPVDADDSL